MYMRDCNPLKIAQIKVNPKAGKLGICICPGIKDTSSLANRQDRDLEQDVQTIVSWQAKAVLTLMETKELERFGVADIGEVITRYKIEWYHFPIQDMCIPDKGIKDTWSEISVGLRSTIVSGGNVLVHCRGGLGRSGMIAARILVELGWDPKPAIQKVREVRPGSIETNDQELFIFAAPVSGNRKTVQTLHLD